MIGAGIFIKVEVQKTAVLHCSLQFIYFGQQVVSVLKMISKTYLCKLEQEGVKLNILRDISLSHSKNWNHISLQIAGRIFVSELQDYH